MRAILVISALIVLIVMERQPANSQSTGSIRGRVVDARLGDPLPSVNVVVKGTPYGASTNVDGEFEIAGLVPGSYTLVAKIVGYEVREVSGIVVREGEMVEQEIILSETAVQLGEVSVYGASLRTERITEAPAAVSVVDAAEIKLHRGSGQLPRLLETQPGVDIVQSGLSDFNVNTRGFNSSLNRRLLVLLDGRDMAIAFLGAQEWNGLSVPVEDLGRLELVRGPASALYGANAFNGVINIQTPSPRDILGTKLTLAGGEQENARVDVRYAGVSDAWSYKVNAGRFQGETWSVSRKNLSFEYPGFTILNNEEIDLPTNKVASTYGSARVDYDYAGGGRATIEGGFSQVEDEIFVTGIGRVQVPKATKPWGRVSHTSDHLYLQLWVAGRNSAEPQLSLSSGLPLIERSMISQADIQYRGALIDKTLFLIGGASIRYQTVETDGTLMLEDRKDNATGIYAQLEYSLSEQLKFVGATRWDRSTIHSNQISPKIAAVWSPSRSHSMRATFNKAFQAPNLSELYLFVLRTATNPFTGLKSYFAYHGNSALNVEKITGYELGYKGVFGNSLFVTVDGYFNVLRDFITDLAPGVHPDYPQPVILPGDSVLRAIWSYSNAGKVHERGAEVALNFYLGDSWIFDVNYAFFDFSVLEKGEKDILIPNAPKHKVNAGITYRHTNLFEAGLTIKHVPAFDWAAGIFQGPVPGYTLVNVAGNYHLLGNLEVGLNISNVFDRRHYQIFGGSLLGRRTIVSLTATF